MFTHTTCTPFSRPSIVPCNRPFIIKSFMLQFIHVKKIELIDNFFKKNLEFHCSFSFPYNANQIFLNFSDILCHVISISRPQLSVNKIPVYVTEYQPKIGKWFFKLQSGISSRNFWESNLFQGIYRHMPFTYIYTSHRQIHSMMDVIKYMWKTHLSKMNENGTECSISHAPTGSLFHASLNFRVHRFYTFLNKILIH